MYYILYNFLSQTESYSDLQIEYALWYEAYTKIISKYLTTSFQYDDI